MAQIVLVGITCFATVGMLSAVGSLGAGGTQDVALSDIANGVLYGMFALTGLVSGGGGSTILGSFVGAVISLAINVRSGALSAVSTTTYLVFIIVMVVRPDGTQVKLEAASTPRHEFRSLIHVLKDPRMISLIPMFFASNYFYAYQGAVNVFYFDGPTRAVNATLEAAGAIVGALIFGFLVLDSSYFKRRTRGYLGLAFVIMTTVTVWSCGLAWQVTFTRHTASPKLHCNEKSYRAKGALYFFYYFGDASYQALAYWIMGAISNDPFTLARYAGFYRAFQSAGAAGSFGMDAVASPYLNEIVSVL
ncbi:hypothetical protein BV25DRAFT_1912703 [Artomyces pyxidatus]|uniref:Uncharacterized protein n=1 Tax=Artomyces pyxidatus TaxID=48021 RepID=A0ACB8TE47_9AGAM|nr:hypothetical protein BV25DRAFT_1912703 [Artomyces pyxidatus]